MLRSLWFRLTGTVVALVIFTLALSFIATLVIAGQQLGEFISNTSDAIIEITAPSDLINGNPETNTSGNRGLEIDPDGRVRFGPSDAGGLEISPDGTVRLDPGDNSMSQINVQIPDIVRSEGTRFARTVQTTILLSTGFAGFLAIVAGTWLFWQITRPLARLRDAAESIAAGQLDARVEVKSKDEVGRVGMAFNHMASELQRQEGLRKQMVADVAHELRTPLSVMQGNLEAMVDELLPASPDELDGLHREVLRLSRLVEDLRLLSLADAGELQLLREPFDANELVESAVRRMASQAKARGVLLGASLSSSPAVILGDEDKIHQVLANLISNALRYTPPGRRVIVSAQATRNEVVMRVTDQGSGIDPADLPDLFERFYKADRSRSRENSGSGLGLSIVRQLVELHGGTVEASLPDAGGLQITLRLPAAQVPARTVTPLPEALR